MFGDVRVQACCVDPLRAGGDGDVLLVRGHGADAAGSSALLLLQLGGGGESGIQAMGLVGSPESFGELIAALEMLDHTGFFVGGPFGEAVFAGDARMALAGVFVEIAVDF